MWPRPETSWKPAREANSGLSRLHCLNYVLTKVSEIHVHLEVPVVSVYRLQRLLHEGRHVSPACFLSPTQHNAMICAVQSTRRAQCPVLAAPLNPTACCSVCYASSEHIHIISTPQIYTQLLDGSFAGKWRNFRGFCRSVPLPVVVLDHPPHACSPRPPHEDAPAACEPIT